MTAQPAPTVGATLAGPDRLLILAALGERDVAGDAWARWAADVDLDDVRSGAFRVLPAVSRNLDRLGIEHPGSSKLRGIYRYSWTHAQVVLRDLLEVQELLAGVEVRSAAHRGVPAVQAALGDPAGILVDQCYLLVDQDDLDRVAVALAGTGWRPPVPIPPKSVRSAFAWLPFEHAERRRVAVHWRSFGPGSPRSRDSDMIARSGPIEIQNHTVWAPQTSDQVLLRCIEMDSLEPVQHLSWALELCGILSATEDPGRQADFVSRRAEEAGVIGECGAALEAIRPVAAALPSLRMPMPVGSGADTVAPRDRAGPSKGHGERLRTAVRAARARYRDACARDARMPRPWGLARFTAAFYGYEWGTGGLGLVGGGVRRWREGARSTVGDESR